MRDIPSLPSAWRSVVSGMRREWSAGGGFVFVGTTLNGPDPKWDEATGGDPRGTFVLILEAQPPGAAAGGAPAQASTAARTRLRFLDVEEKADYAKMEKVSRTTT